MTHLTISLLGSFQAALDGQLVTGFVSDKARALLAFLAVEVERPHRREVLVGLLWPEYPERSARASLRNVLANVRRAIGDREADPPFLCIARQTIQFNPGADAQVDVAAFIKGLELASASPQSHAETIHEMEAAVALYQGGFLEGFSLPDSPAFEEWALLKREQLQRQALAALGRLADHYEQRAEYERALRFAWRRVEADPYRGVAQRGLMRLLALSGQREAAIMPLYYGRRHTLTKSWISTPPPSAIGGPRWLGTAGRVGGCPRRPGSCAGNHGPFDCFGSRHVAWTRDHFPVEAERGDVGRYGTYGRSLLPAARRDRKRAGNGRAISAVAHTRQPGAAVPRFGPAIRSRAGVIDRA